MKVWAAHAVPSPAAAAEAAGRAPGTVLRLGRDGIDVATADGVLRVTALRKPGGRRQAVDVFMQSYRP